MSVDPGFVTFEYREFYDVPRSVLVRIEGRLILLESRFDAERDDYPAAYVVFELPPDHGSEPDWGQLPGRAIRRLGELPVNTIEFDPSKRRFIRIAPIAALLRPSEPPTPSRGDT